MRNNKGQFIKGSQPMNGFKKGNHPKTQFKKGHKMWLGKKQSLEHKNKTIKNLKIGKGENAGNWKGGITTYERKLWFNRQRRILKLGNGGSHTQNEWEALKIQYNSICPACKKTEPVIKLTVDHIIPLSKGGSDNIENIQPLCFSCNSRKHNKILSKFSVDIGKRVEDYYNKKTT